MKTLKASELNSDFYIYGNKGAVWGNKCHLGHCGKPETLCGVPMLSSNWARIENVQEIGCPACIDLYETITGVKVGYLPEVSFKTVLLKIMEGLQQYYSTTDPNGLSEGYQAFIKMNECKDIDQLIESMNAQGFGHKNNEPLEWWMLIFLIDDSYPRECE